ncbi:MAG: bifunctional UDP-N-acetylmuramoyl-tripeptide:D-alanyl-D-alanine ligase/alanine racemase [Bacteroidales bacterium]|nr:bifunctional UDP-N-acetylmuramoyl-tripeptide:D-alanyl-D-alanine ligase/alanine racemase [Bacteroidales bacterium]MDD4216293.1 bifunctional UDP-N-acetylmuramoyl-tripeptide:D-alanyl-D-alanine ligase/alanine racemase [Bacteroidales bacterium]MDY0141595.1 bifunctional UDP-N-acetylmuramoyl-tripeptide:D-alanyl-D-alanine ligase/alanine racemase [Bacteroidales bacterium]
MLKFKLIDIAKILDGKFYGNPDNEFDKLLTDSRKIVKYHESLYIALNGKQHNGHNFIPELYEKGIRSFIISKKIKTENYPQASFLLVGNSVNALQLLAALKRSKYQKPLLAITGSNGKTVVKEWLSHILSPYYNITRSPKSYNSQIGVPLSLWLINNSTDIAIVEAGISEPNEMECLEKIIKPNVGVFTNIGAAHQANFSSENHKITEKFKLFANCNTVICKYDYKNHLKNKNTKCITWSDTEKNASILINKIEKHHSNSKIFIVFNNDKYEIEIPFTDDGSIENAITCFAYITHLFPKPDKQIIKRFLSLSGVEMRLQTIDAINNSILINDSYNSDINSLEIALDYLNQKKANKTSILILSDILQNSDDENKFYKSVSKLIAEKNINKLIAIGETIRKYKSYFSQNTDFYPSTEDFLTNIVHSNFDNSAILLKGARNFKFEDISKILQSKSHESYLEINLSLMRENLLYFRSILEPQTKIMAMVKAFSYGIGYREVSAFLQHNRIDYLTVAYTDEGVELRKRGIITPIMVMNPSAKDFKTMIDYALEPEIYSIGLLSELEKELKSSKTKNFPVHIKINTGMNRLGINENEVSEFCKIVKESGKINILSVFSHLAGSDSNKFDNFTHKQAELFVEICDKISSITGHKPIRHILNSAGIIRFPQYQFEMVRLGIGLYGLLENITDKAEQVSTFKSVISQIHNVEAGESISYNRSGKTNAQIKTATIPVGYADGIDRRLGNGNWYFMINGQKAYTIGDICMDMCMVEITKINANVGDEVIVFGNQNNISKMAKILNTIPYEVISGISERIKRVYIEE